jgi:hypothetical protein
MLEQIKKIKGKSRHGVPLTAQRIYFSIEKYFHKVF